MNAQDKSVVQSVVLLMVIGAAGLLTLAWLFKGKVEF